jgi:hypothetical protein
MRARKASPKRGPQMPSTEAVDKLYPRIFVDTRLPAGNLASEPAIVAAPQAACRPAKVGWDSWTTDYRRVREVIQATDPVVPHFIRGLRLFPHRAASRGGARSC